MRRRYINFLLTYFHNSSKKAHITKYGSLRLAHRLPRRPVSSNWPAATPTRHFFSGPSARHVLVRPHHYYHSDKHLRLQCNTPVSRHFRPKTLRT